MYSYADRMRAVQLLAPTIRQLGCPTKNALKGWYREYERCHNLPARYVRSALRRANWQPHQRQAGTARLLDEHRAWLIERASQLPYSARILYQLTRERGFTGCYETVKLAVRPLRAEASLGGLTQWRFETAPGEQAQCDRGQVTVPMSTGGPGCTCS